MHKTIQHRMLRATSSPHPLPLSLRERGAIVYLLLAAAAVGGCSRGERPNLAAVRGRITLDGNPLAGAAVVFTPVEGGRQSLAVTDPQGRYELLYIRHVRGAKVGPHTVRITTADADCGRPEILPARYHATTTLHVEVKAGANECDFTLTSGSDRNSG